VPLDCAVPASDECLGLAGSEGAHLDDGGAFNRGGLVALRTGTDDEVVAGILPELAFSPRRHLGAIVLPGNFVKAIEQDQAPPGAQLLLKPSRGLLCAHRAECRPQQGAHRDGQLGGNGVRVVAQVQEDRDVAHIVRFVPARALSQTSLAGGMPEQRGLAAARTAQHRQDGRLLAAEEITQGAVPSSVIG
jgi:hypothetical protein